MISPLRSFSAVTSLGRRGDATPSTTATETPPVDQVCLSRAEFRSAASSSLVHQAGRCLLLGCGLVGGALGTVTADQAQQAQVQVRQGVRYDLTELQVLERTRNTLTAEQIPDGQPHFTAWDIDPNQASNSTTTPARSNSISSIPGGPSAKATALCSAASSARTEPVKT